MLLFVRSLSLSFTHMLGWLASGKYGRQVLAILPKMDSMFSAL